DQRKNSQILLSGPWRVGKEDFRKKERAVQYAEKMVSSFERLGRLSKRSGMSYLSLQANVQQKYVVRYLDYRDPQDLNLADGEVAGKTFSVYNGDVLLRGDFRKLETAAKFAASHPDSEKLKILQPVEVSV